VQTQLNRNNFFKRNKLSSAIFAILAPLSIPNVVMAEELDTEEIEVISVTGIKGSLVSALNNKRFDSSIVDGIAAEDLGKFPDQNVAESLQRVTGVTIDRAAGEGTKISIRGFGPQFNTVLLNERTVPTDDGGRSFSFDMLASELISGADVYKTSQASKIEGSIGGLVSIKTAKPLNYDGFKAAGNVKAVYDTLSEETNPVFSGLVSQNFNDTFGVLASFSYQERKARIDEAAISSGYRSDYVIEGSDPYTDAPTSEKVLRPQNAVQNYKIQDRERVGATLVGQWAASDELLITSDILYSKLTVDDSQTQLARWFSNPLYNANINGNGTVDSFTRVPKPLVSQGVYQLWDNGSKLGTGQWNGATFVSENRDVETTMIGLNAEWQATDDLSFVFDLQTSTAEARSGNNAKVGLSNPTQVPTHFALSGDSFTWNSSDDDFAGTTDSYYNNNVQFFSKDFDDDITEARIDATWDVEYFGVVESIKTGFYYSDREKVANNGETNWGGVVKAYSGFHYNAPASIMYDVTPTGGFLDGGFVNSWYGYDPQNLVDFFHSDEIYAQTAGFGEQIMNNFANGDPKYATEAEAQVAADAAVAAAVTKLDKAQALAGTEGYESSLGAFTPQHHAGKSWAVTEETVAFYIEADIAGEGWSGNLGLRYIETDTESFGNGNILNAIVLDTATGNASLSKASGEAISSAASYDKLLPSLNLKFDISDDLVARFAFSETLTRPQLGDLRPTVNYNGTGIYDVNGAIDFNGTISGKNVALKPYTSTNIDIALEWYYSDDSYVGATIFHKDIDNWIIDQSRTETLSVPSIVDGEANGDVDLDFESTKPFNSESSTAQGLEFAVLHNFDSGFGVQFNYTYIDSDAAFEPGQENLSFTLAGLSKDSFNLITYYEQGPLQARLAYNWRSDYVNCATCSRGGQPVQTEAYGQFDASVSYDFHENFTVFAEGVNITDEDTRKYSTYESRFLSLQDTGARFSLGVRATF